MARPRLDAVVTKGRLRERIDALTATHRLLGPVRHTEPECDPPRRWFYERVSSAADLDLEFDYCVYGPKSALLPPRETLLRYDAQSRRFEATPVLDSARIALIGVHPCDLRAIALLDAVFARDHRDDHYLDRRANLLIVGVDCPSPCHEGVFCREMGADEAAAGFDVMLYPMPPGDDDGSLGSRAASRYGVVYGTDAGRNWLTGGEAAVQLEPSDEDRRRLERYLDHKLKAFAQQLRVDRREIPSVLADSYDSLVWAATAQRCYSCGSCTLVCPTCYCFDIQDETDLAGTTGVRERTWDSCMLRDFALVAGGHNFRSRSAQRLRHRIFRKGSWIEHRNGIGGCVGCGRCTRACTAHISIVEILNQLADERRSTARAALPGTSPAGGTHGH